MKEFIIENIETISMIISTIIFIIMLITFKEVKDTKFEVIHKWYFIILMLIGLITSSKAIGEWIIK